MILAPWGTLTRWSLRDLQCVRFEWLLAPMRVHRLHELGADELGARSEPVSFVTSDVQTLGRTLTQARRSKQVGDACRVKASHRETRHELQTETSHEIVPPRRAPESPLSMIVDVERQEPIRESGMACTVNGVTPFSNLREKMPPTVPVETSALHADDRRTVSGGSRGPRAGTLPSPGAWRQRGDRRTVAPCGPERVHPVYTGRLRSTPWASAESRAG
jgi:hypothetical protein